MCGFAGVVTWDDRYRVSSETLAKMSAAVAHRGPDGEGHYINHQDQVTPDRPQVALAFRRLAILDPDPRSNQPFTDGRHWLVFNGEIYNFRELRKELTALRPDYQWRTTGDTEVLLCAYAVWREKCVEHLNGMFAFVVWDDIEKSLFLARDRMGQKPLFVSCPSHGVSFNQTPFDSSDIAGIAFASELSALTRLEWFDTTINSGAIGTYLSLGYIPDCTIYQGATKMQPSTCAMATPRGIRSQYYFQSFKSFRSKTITDKDAVEKARRLVRNAVSKQLVADVPLGCFLSGGVDSSIIAAAMRTAESRETFTFSVGFGDARYDERQYAGAVAHHLGTRHFEFEVRPDAANDLPKLAAVFGEPFADSSALPTHYLSRETRSHVKVALSGDGGDELFGGYDRYRALQLSESISRVPHFLTHFGQLICQGLLPSAHPKSRTARIRRLLASVHLPAGLRYASYMQLFDPPLIAALLNKPMTSPNMQWENLSDAFDVGWNARPLVPNALVIDRISYLPGDLLTKVDRCSMLHGLEVRSPFLDHELVQFAAGLTTDQLLRGGPKRMLREAFKDDLPAWVFKRKKMGFAVPIGEWFRGPLQSMLRDTLFAGDSFGRQHFNLKVVERLVDEHEQNRVDHSQRLYALLMLELWWNTVKK